MTNFSSSNKGSSCKQATLKTTQTLEKKHINSINSINNKNSTIDKLKKTLAKLEKEINDLDIKRTNGILINLEHRANLLQQKDDICYEINNIERGNDEINYYNLTGDILIEYYGLKNTVDEVVVEKKSILDFLGQKKQSKKEEQTETRSSLFNKYYQRTEGVRLVKDDGKNRIKYCKTCNVEKILEVNKSSYICPSCGICG